MSRFQFMVLLVLLNVVMLTKGATVLPSVSESLTLKCLDGQIQVDVKTNGHFSGAIYTQGSYRQNGCYIDANSGINLQLTFPLTDCKTIQQSTGVYTNVLIVQNEDDLITQGDSAFEIQCDYNPRFLTLESETILEFGKKESIDGRNSAKASISKGDIYMQGSVTSGENITSVSNGSNVAVLNLRKLPKHHAY